MAFNMDDYVDVHKRIEKFYEKFPEGSVQTSIVRLDDHLVVMRAEVYRHPADERPAIAHSQLGIPGKTNYTRDSEIENAETSAVGRAIAFLGFEVKNGIASGQEVRNKIRDEETAREPRKGRPDWMNRAQALVQAAGLKFKDIPDLKIHPNATGADVENALVAWRIAISEGQPKAGDAWVLEQLSSAIEEARKARVEGLE